LASCFRLRPDGLDLSVRLTPKSPIDAIEGIGRSADGSAHLIMRVRAVPEKGAANAALERLLANRLGLPKSAVRVISGATSRLKTVRLSGDAAVLTKALDAAIRPGS
jgi:uncharacterized protein YggU (UPF0235/DUF167 family)